MDSFDYLKSIRASNKYQFALLTTYDFEVGFFESFLLNSFINNGVKKVSVFVDGGQLSVALEKVKDCFIGKRYVVNPIRTNAAFHPKLILLLGENNAKLFVSSANLTTSGFCINNEIVNEFVYDKDHPENLKVISQAISFFEKLDRLSFGLDSDLFADIRQLPYYGKSNPNQLLFLLDSIDKPILDQIHSLVQSATEIDIAVPYYDNSLGAIEELNRLFPKARITVWLQNGKSRFPNWRVGDGRFSLSAYLKVSSNSNGSIVENDNFYHGKVLRFKNADRSYVVYGSANCTKSALVLSHKTGGNIECDILEIGSLTEFDGFFDGFVGDSTKLVCESLNERFLEYRNIRFLYGQMLSADARLVFECNRVPQDLQVYIGDITLSSTIHKNTIEVVVEPDLLAALPEVFSVSVSSEEGIEEVQCWIIYKDYLELFRMPDDTGGLFSFDIDSTGDKYFQDRYAFLSAYAMSVEEILQEAEIERHFQVAATEPDPENDDNDSDGIIDYTPPSIDIIRQHKLIGRIHYIESVFRDRFESWANTATQMTHIKKKDSVTGEIVEPTFANPDQDKRFIRFVKAQYKKLMNPDYQAKVNPERFYAVLLAIFEIFDKFTIYSKKNPKEMLLTPFFTADAKKQLLLSISKMKVSENTAKNLAVLTILTIVMNHILNSEDKDSRIDRINQILLASLEHDEHFRWPGYIELVWQVSDMLAVRSVDALVSSEINYVDRLFGYKPFSRIIDMIHDDYGEKCRIEIDNTRITVEAKVDSISSFMTMREGSLRELNNYVKMQGRYKSFFVDIVLQGIQKGPNPAIRITYLVSDLPSTTFQQRIFRKNGKTEKSVQTITRLE